MLDKIIVVKDAHAVIDPLKAAARKASLDLGQHAVIPKMSCGLETIALGQGESILELLDWQVHLRGSHANPNDEPFVFFRLINDLDGLRLVSLSNNAHNELGVYEPLLCCPLDSHLHAFEDSLELDAV